jgi:hypothetical protein
MIHTYTCHIKTLKPLQKHFTSNSIANNEDTKMTSKKNSNTHHVVPNPNGGWDLKRGGAERASGHFSTKQEAVNAGREVSTNQKTELKIHNLDGKIAQSDSHGNDPRNIKG